MFDNEIYNNPYYFINNMNNYYAGNRNNLEWGNIKDFGPNPFVINIKEATEINKNFRTTLWTGKNLQITLMSIGVGESIGLEQHSNLDQFIRIEEGIGLVKMGNSSEYLDFQREVFDDFAFVIPAGKWHDLVNIGNKPIKLYSIYAPPAHEKGTIHISKEDDKH